MPFSRVKTAATMLLAALAVVGCAEPNAPAHVIESVYVAQSVDGDPLPVELLVVGTTHLYLVAASVAFETGAEARRIQTIRSVDASAPGVPAVETDTSYYDVTIHGDTTFLNARCSGPAALCIAPQALVRVGETYHVAIAYEPLRTMTLVRQ